MENMNILIVGVGGQGTLLASRVFGNYAKLLGKDCKLSEVHGMAQRGGSVVTHFKMADKVFAPVIAEGEADVVIAFEKLEAARYLHFLKPGGKVIYNDREIMPLPVVIGAVKYPDDLAEKIRKKTPDAVSLNALAIAKECGSIRALNTVMLGVACRELVLDEPKFREALISAVPAKFLELNLAAFERGLSAGK